MSVSRTSYRKWHTKKKKKKNRVLFSNSFNVVKWGSVDAELIPWDVQKATLYTFVTVKHVLIIHFMKTSRRCPAKFNIWWNGRFCWAVWGTSARMSSAWHLYISRGSDSCVSLLQGILWHIVWHTRPIIYCKPILDGWKNVEDCSVKCLMKIDDLKHKRKDVLCLALVYFKRIKFVLQPAPGHSVTYFLTNSAYILLQANSGWLEECKRLLCQVFDTNWWSQAQAQECHLLGTCIFQGHQIHASACSRAFCDISSDILSLKFTAS